MSNAVPDKCPRCRMPLADPSEDPDYIDRYYRQRDRELQIELDRPFTWGKYKGETLGSVLIKDTGWLKWALQEVEYFSPSIAIQTQILNAPYKRPNAHKSFFDRRDLPSSDDDDWDEYLTDPRDDSEAWGFSWDDFGNN